MFQDRRIWGAGLALLLLVLLLLGDPRQQPSTSTALPHLATISKLTPFPGCQPPPHFPSGLVFNSCLQCSSPSAPPLLDLSSKGSCTEVTRPWKLSYLLTSRVHSYLLTPRIQSSWHVIDVNIAPNEKALNELELEWTPELLIVTYFTTLVMIMYLTHVLK